MLVNPLYSAPGYLLLEIEKPSANRHITEKIVGIISAQEFLQGNRMYRIGGNWSLGKLTDKQAKTIEDFIRLHKKKWRISDEIQRLERKLAELRAEKDRVICDLDAIQNGNGNKEVTY